jgi:condensin complex subunit 3
MDNNITIRGLLAELIIPAVHREELEFREKGLHCLGLLCLVSEVRLLLKIGADMVADECWLFAASSTEFH